MNKNELEQFKADFKREYNKEYDEDLSAFMSYCNSIKLDGLKHFILELTAEVKKLSK